MVQKTIDRAVLSKELAQRERLHATLGEVEFDLVLPCRLPSFHLERYELHSFGRVHRDGSD
jgi:hypothetical protein